MNRLVIIPALNPDDKIFEVIEKIKQLDFHVIVVNDGSDLSYLSLFNKLKNKCIVLSHEKNEGKGSAIKTALQWVKDEQKKYDVIGIMEADGQHLAEDMNHILEISYKNPSSLIIGSRYMNRNVPWKSYFGNKITSFFNNRKKIMDTQTGMRAFSSQLCDDFLALKGERYEYEMKVLMYCARQNIPIVEVPIKTIYHDKRNSYSHFRKIRDSFKIYQQLFKFTLISFLSFVIDYLLIFLFIHILPNTLTMVSIIILNIELRRKFTFLLWEK